MYGNASGLLEVITQSLPDICYICRQEKDSGYNKTIKGYKTRNNSMNNLESLVVRRLHENDKESFLLLRMAFLEEEFVIHETEKKQLVENLKVYFDEHIMKGDFIGVVGECNGKVVSAAYLTVSERPANPNFMNGKIGTLLNVYTYPECRKKGFATKVIDEIMEEAKKMNIKFIDLNATESGVNVYRKVGFVESNYKSMRIKL